MSWNCSEITYGVHIKKVTLFVIALQFCLSFSFAQSDKKYRLVWADEFNYNGMPDTSKWNCQSGFIRNYEPQWYQPENARVANGFLTITARKEKKVNPNYNQQSKNWKINRSSAPYTSASLSTKGKFDFKYGKVQMRAKIDIAKGMWPAFWMLGTKQVTWPANGEVDIMEYFRGNLHANAVWAGKNGETWSIRKTATAALGGERWAKKFHIWEMVWDEKKIVITVDNQILNSIDLSQTINHKTKENPFQENFYLLVNLAMGQKWEKVPDSSLPSKFVVDYIRVYQKPN